MAQGKYLSLEEARKLGKLKQFARGHEIEAEAPRPRRRRRPGVGQVGRPRRRRRGRRRRLAHRCAPRWRPRAALHRRPAPGLVRGGCESPVNELPGFCPPFAGTSAQNRAKRGTKRQRPRRVVARQPIVSQGKIWWARVGSNH